MDKLNWSNLSLCSKFVGITTGRLEPRVLNKEQVPLMPSRNTADSRYFRITFRPIRECENSMFALNRLGSRLR